MNIIYTFLAIAALPIVFFTLYAKTERGQKIRLGSYFIIKNFASKIFRVRSLRDKILLTARLLFALLLAILVIDPLQIEIPERDYLVHRSRESTGPVNKAVGSGVILNFPEIPLDSFNEDIFFLEALAENLPVINDSLTIVYNPDERRLDNTNGDAVVIPGPSQDRNAYKKWSDIFYLSDLLENEQKIGHTDYSVKKYYRPVITDIEMVSIYSELEDGTPLAFSVKGNGGRVLFFTVGMSDAWGEAGISGTIMDIIIRFQKNITISESASREKMKALRETGRAEGRLPLKTLLYAALVFFIFELFLFIYRSWNYRKGTGAPLILVFILFFTGNLSAGGFVFIELDSANAPNPENRAMFSKIKREAEKRTSVRISPAYYKKITTAELSSGKMPELPYLWILGCKERGFFSNKVKSALSKFMERGGILFIDTCGKPGDSAFLSEVNSFIVEQTGYDPEKGILPRLPGDHPLYKSFFLLPGGIFFGIDVSKSTNRTALIVSRGDFKKGILRDEDMALRTGINVLLYMLSGNYKSDQIHTRQILKKLKDREYYR